MSAPDVATPQQRATFLRALNTYTAGQTVSANTIHDDARLAAQLPGNAMGGLFRGGVEAGYLFPIGYITATAPSRKGGVIRVYERTTKPIPTEQERAAS